MHLSDEPFLFVAAMVTLFSLSVVSARDIVLEMKKEGHTNGPRSEIPVIIASIDSSVCRTNVSEYLGNVHVAITDALGDTLITHTESVCDSTQFTTDVTNLADGSYTITYTLEDSTTYEGEFEKE